MFKVALYGNLLDFILIQKLEEKGNRIQKLIDNKSVFKGGGIHKGTKEKYEPFFPILNKPLIENSEINQIYSYSNGNRVIKENDIYIKSGRENGLFEGRQILIKEQAKNESEIVVSLTDQPYVIRSGIFSIASTSNEKFIKLLFGYMISDLYEYYTYMTSGSWGVSTRPQIRLDEEYLAFPIVELNDLGKDELIKFVDAIIKPYEDFHSNFNLGQPLSDKASLTKLNSLVDEAYHIDGYEKDLISYTLEISRYQFQESKQHIFTRKIGKREDILNQYIDVFTSEFKNLYTDEYLLADVYILDYFIAINFVFQNESPQSTVNYISDVTDEKAIFEVLSNNVSINKKTQNLYIQKDIKGFEDNSFYIIKPNEYKCWHRAMAWYDVAEIKAAIEEAEIYHLTDTWNAS